MAIDRKRIGEILVEKGTISEKTLNRALEKAKVAKEKIGVTLKVMGVATSDEITDALAVQYGYSKVSNIAEHSFSQGLLATISVDIALRYLIFPLKMDRGKLYLAMADPEDNKIICNIAKNNKLVIVPILSTSEEIIRAINKHYIGKDILCYNNKKTVLVVEDNLSVRLTLEKMLTSAGYRVLSAKDGIEAFQTALYEIPDVILTDKEMPRFDGYRLLESLKAVPDTRRIPVLLLTGSSDKKEEAEAFRRGFFDFMVKPIEAIALVNRIKRAIQVAELTIQKL